METINRPAHYPQSDYRNNTAAERTVQRVLVDT
jgi:hypothetical protein